jgi:hypothetical protein
MGFMLFISPILYRVANWFIYLMTFSIANIKPYIALSYRKINE